MIDQLRPRPRPLPELWLREWVLAYIQLQWLILISHFIWRYAMSRCLFLIQKSYCHFEQLMLIGGFQPRESQIFAQKLDCYSHSRSSYLNVRNLLVCYQFSRFCSSIICTMEKLMPYLRGLLLRIHYWPLTLLHLFKE